LRHHGESDYSIDESMAMLFDSAAGNVGVHPQRKIPRRFLFGTP